LAARSLSRSLTAIALNRKLARRPPIKPWWTLASYLRSADVGLVGLGWRAKKD
jgi:hypothetical protein